MISSWSPPLHFSLWKRFTTSTLLYQIINNFFWYLVLTKKHPICQDIGSLITLLKDNCFNESVKIRIKELLKENSVAHYKKHWEFFKYRVRSVAIKRSKELKKEQKRILNAQTRPFYWKKTFSIQEKKFYWRNCR